MTNIKSSDGQDLLQGKIDRLESSVRELLLYCNRLTEENDSFKHNNKQLMIERSELQSKNDKARGQVEAMVDRLKAMDRAS